MVIGSAHHVVAEFVTKTNSVMTVSKKIRTIIFLIVSKIRTVTFLLVNSVKEDVCRHKFLHGLLN